MLVLIVVSIIVPRFGAATESQRQREFLNSLQRIFSQAKIEAGEQQDTVSVTFDDATNTFEVPDSRYRITVPEGDVQVTGFFQDGLDTPSSDWQAEFQPDGTSNQAAINLTAGGRSLVIELDRLGHVQMREGEFEPNNADEEWDAGEIERRG
jgi:Tfp pilus assembly protein FimT